MNRKKIISKYTGPDMLHLKKMFEFYLNENKPLLAAEFLLFIIILKEKQIKIKYCE